MTQLSGIVEKGWGHEEIWATNEKYCGKFMHFNRGSKFSMHFHSDKDETWYCLSGKFTLRWIDTTTAEIFEEEFLPKHTWRNQPKIPHQLICHEAGTIVEVSTPDSVEDNYRILPGDSQSK
jgi:mannose-6-phosphate isomerase-like protein (cupin superfamily)